MIWCVTTIFGYHLVFEGLRFIIGNQIGSWSRTRYLIISIPASISLVIIQSAYMAGVVKEATAVAGLGSSGNRGETSVLKPLAANPRCIGALCHTNSRIVDTMRTVNQDRISTKLSKQYL